jgi:hypothetical protein
MSHLKIWILLAVAGVFAALTGINSWGTTLDGLYFGGTALLAHWVLGPTQ